MNRTIILIEVQDSGDTEATFIVKGERNDQIMFEEQFEYKNEENHPFHLHLFSKKIYRKFHQLDDNLSILCISIILRYGIK